MTEKNDRLLTQKELDDIEWTALLSYEEWVAYLKAQDAKTARMVAEEIFGEIENHRWQGHKPVGFDPLKGYLLSESDLQALKSKYLKGAK